jgi:hypothetical protein
MTTTTTTTTRDLPFRDSREGDPGAADDAARVRRHLFEQGPGKMNVTPPVLIDMAAPTTSGAVPDLELDRHEPFPALDPDALAGTYPHLPAVAPASTDRLAAAVADCFSPRRWELSNAYNEHRAYPSVRSKYPVQAFLVRGGVAWWVDPLRERLSRVRGSDLSATVRDGVVLVGRYSDLPGFYRGLRGPLIDCELGIHARALTLFLQLHGIGVEQVGCAPGEAATLLAAIGGRDGRLDSVPVLIRTAPPVADGSPLADAIASRSAPPATPRPPLAAGPDASLEDIAHHNALVRRATRTVALPTTAAPAGHTPGAAALPSWQQVLDARTSGTMPMGMSGMSGRRQVRPAGFLADLVAAGAADAAAEPAGSATRLHLCVADVEGVAAGVYEAREGALVPRVLDASVMARLEAVYGYPLAAVNGCAVRRATVVAFFSADVGALAEGAADAHWWQAQLMVGWRALGICLAAAAHGAYARPVRAFDELNVQRLLGIEGDEVPVLGVVIGTAAYRSPALSLHPRRGATTPLDIPQEDLR